MIVGTQVSLATDQLLLGTKTDIKGGELSGFEAVLALLANLQSGAEMISPDLGAESTDASAKIQGEMNALLFKGYDVNHVSQDESLTGQELPKYPVVSEVGTAEDEKISAEQMIGWVYNDNRPQQNQATLQSVTTQPDERKENDLNGITKLQAIQAELLEKTENQQKLEMHTEVQQRGIGDQPGEKAPTEVAFQTEEQRAEIHRLKQAQQQILRNKQSVRPISEVSKDAGNSVSKTTDAIVQGHKNPLMFFKYKLDAVSEAGPKYLNQETGNTEETIDLKQALFTNLAENPVKEMSDLPSLSELTSTPIKVPAKDVAQELPKIIFSQEKLGLNGSKEFIVQLQPEEMGRMTVKLTSHEGVISVRIFAENQDSRSIIENGLQNLKQAFEEQGLKCGRMDVELGGQYLNQNNSQQQQWFSEGYAGMPKVFSDSRHYMDSELAASGVSHHISGNGIDYMV